MSMDLAGDGIVAHLQSIGLLDEGGDDGRQEDDTGEGSHAA